jgi:hypothetical protein
LYSNPSIWEKFPSRGADIINQNFNEISESKKLIEDLKDLNINLAAHRNYNFLGSMLQYHTVNSFKYLSKWIEEKNKAKIDLRFLS